MRRAWWGVSFLLVTAVALGVQPVRGESAPAATDCAKCKPATARWDWKANGYGLGADDASADKAAHELALQLACDKSAQFLAPRKLSCKLGCAEGEVESRCEPSEKPKCTRGSHASDPGMWTFVCRKEARYRKIKADCTPERAKAQPAYTMCDTKVRMVKSRACGDPSCQAPSGSSPSKP